MGVGGIMWIKGNMSVDFILCYSSHFMLLVSFPRVSEYLYMFMLGVCLYLMCLRVVHCE